MASGSQVGYSTSFERGVLWRRSAPFLALVCSALTSGSVAHASGISVARFGGELGHPMANNATALYYNPAGIANTTGTHLFLDGTLAWRRVQYWHARAASDVPEPPGAEGANTGEGELFDWIASPMLGAHSKIGPVALGLAFYTPFGGQSGYERNERFENSTHPGPVDGIARWYAIEGSIRSSYFTFGAAYEHEPSRLSVGLSFNLIYSVINTIRARNPQSNNSVAAEGRSHLDVESWDYSLGAGLLYEAVPDELWLAFSYQSRPNLDGDMVLEGTLTNHFFGQTETPSDVDVYQSFPDVYRAGFSYRPYPALELRVFGDLTRWSALERQCVTNAGSECNIDDDTGRGASEILSQERDWHDTWGVRLGSSIFLTRDVEFLSGLGFSSNAVPDSTLEPALPDWDAVSASLGGRVALSDTIAASATYTQLFYFPRSNVGESRLAQLEAPSKGPDAGGAYQHWVGALNANVDIAF